MTKYLVNSFEDVVNEALTGFVAIYPQLELHLSKRVVLAPQTCSARHKVAVISGGGSGHEPFSAGFVGSGMLNASVSGSIYAAPTSNNILHAIECVSKFSKGGCLVVIPNYTGDCLNFGLAIEKAKSQNLKVAAIVVGDDCSIPENEVGLTGKRALPGILFVIKISGALARRGHDLEFIEKHAKIVTDNIASCSVGLTPCSIPGEGKSFELLEDEMEFGLGLHGEAGYKRMKLEKSSVTVALMLETIVKSLNLAKGDEITVLVNNFGALSQIEQSIVVKDIVQYLEKSEITPLRIYSGILMSSLNSAGVHISLLKLPKTHRELLLSCLDEETNAPNWPGCNYSRPSAPSLILESNIAKSTERITGPSFTTGQQILLKVCLERACNAIIVEERVINELDRGCGDGDCGTTIKNLAKGILVSMDTLTLKYPASLLSELARIAEDYMGGTSGALYSLMFTTASSFISGVPDNSKDWKTIWYQAWRAGLTGIEKYSKARLGDKTMLDVLVPCIVEYEKRLSESYQKVVAHIDAVARTSAENTKNLVPRAGRASYVKQKEYLGKIDAGAYAVSIWITAISEALQNKGIE